MAAAKATRADQIESLISKAPNPIHLSSGLWARYMRGDTTPSGSLERYKTNLVLRIDKAYPGTGDIFYHPVWELMDFRRVLTPFEIRTLVLRISPSSLPLLKPLTSNLKGSGAERGNPFWKSSVNPNVLHKLCSGMLAMDAVAVALAELRMAHLAQQPVQFSNGVFISSLQLERLAKEQLVHFPRQKSVCLLLEYWCLHLAQVILVEAHAADAKMKSRLEMCRNDWKKRAQAHERDLSTGLQSVFKDWAHRIKKEIYCW